MNWAQSYFYKLTNIMVSGPPSAAVYFSYFYTEAGTITFILISDHILDHGSKIDLRSYQDHIAVQ
jgi:hypothetical protein